MKDITLFGAGGHCYAAVELIRSLGEYSPKLVYDDAPKNSDILGVPVLKYTEQQIVSSAFCITIGNNSVRKKVASQYDLDCPSFVHSSAIIYPSSKVGKGTLVHPNAILDADVKVGNYCIVNNNATISHNVVVGDFVHVAIQAAIAGGVKIGEGTLVGAGSVILPNIEIGKWVTIGAGAVVAKDLADYSVVYGNPASLIKINRSNE